MTRRQFLKISGASLAASASSRAIGAAPETPSSTQAGEEQRPGSGRATAPSQLDRPALVRRHSPVVTRFDPFSALSLGNGEFAFTADVTGLQTFSAECEKQFPLCTASHWGWHTTPLPAGLNPAAFRYQDFDTYGRTVGYATSAKGQEPLFNWLRQNPHRLHLGRIGLELRPQGKQAAKPEDLRGIRQTLDLWTGRLQSRFELAGKPVLVETCCHPELDLVSARIESPLLASGLVQVRLAFPYGSPEVPMADWLRPDRHTTELARQGARRVNLTRKLDRDEYHVSLAWSEGASLAQAAPHEFLLGAQAGSLEFVCLFSPQPFGGTLPTFARTQAASAVRWEKFWTEGGIVDLQGSTDQRAQELERRMVLSLYQTAIHCAGSLPSAETGLLCNSWYGKFHLEMHWWHCVHFAAWGRFPLFEKSIGFYQRILPVAQDIARRQGYQGARWPKMVGPDGHDSPSPVGPLLIWQQPHPLYYAELCYRQRPERQTLEAWRDIVFATADFLASFAARQNERYVLGPPLKTVSENANTLETRNPTFELAYWRFGLRVAQAWRERLGLAPAPNWDLVLQKLAPLPMQDGVYLMQEGMTDTYTQWNWEHPALVGALGMQPGDGVDPATMRRTVRRVLETWQWERCWGWDFPLMAMAAARVGEPALAIQALALEVPKNRYWPNGHNYQRENLTAYLPGNGGLLCALAMMAAGWTGSPKSPAPGFPADGTWRVRSEGLRTWL